MPTKGSKKSHRSKQSKKQPAKSSRSKRSKGSKKSAPKAHSARSRFRTENIPKTDKLQSKRSVYRPRRRVEKASATMSKTELEFMAKSRGIPFGGLNKTNLVKKINAYDF